MRLPHRRRLVLGRIDSQEIEPTADDDIDGAEDGERAAPAERVDQDLDKRDEDGAGKPAPQGQGRDAAPGVAGADTAGDHREGGPVEGGGVEGPDRGEDRIEYEEGRKLRTGDKG